MWQTNHLEVLSKFFTYLLVTKWPFKKGDRHKPWATGPLTRFGHSSQIVREGELPLVERQIEFKLLLWFYHSSCLNFIGYNLTWKWRKGAQRTLTLLTFQKGYCQKLGPEAFLVF